MSEELHLVAELAIILIAAGVFTIISKALKQPVILGYIVAGFLVGPHLGLFPQFSAESVHEWSEIGIIFLLFGLGLEFSFKKLLKVGSSALLMAGVNCIGMMFVGVMTGNALGWSTMESIFLGGMLSMSSTTIIVKAYNDMGLKKKPYANLIFGALVVEDLIAVLLMVLLSTLAVSNKFAGGEMLLALGKLVLYIVLSFIVGIYVFPTLFKKARNYLSDEILLIVSIGLCFGMVVLASKAGFSSALGAFLMGSILSETFEGENIARLTSGIKDLFGAIFFVSVGMMVDPGVIAEHWSTILVITVVAMAGILICSTTGALLAGKGLDTAVHSGFTLAQIGEFSFIIAGLGCSLGVLRDFIYPVIISASVITTFTTPYMIKAGDPVTLWLSRVLPASVLARINPSQSAVEPESNVEKREWRTLLKSYFIRVGIYSILLLGVLLASYLFLDKLIVLIFPSLSDVAVKWTGMIVTLAVMSPFLYGLAVMNSDTVNRSARYLLKSRSSFVWPIVALMTLRAALATFFVLLVVVARFKLSFFAIILVVLLVAAVYLVARFTVKRTGGMESRFMRNFNAKDLAERKKTIVKSTIDDMMAGYDVHIGYVTVSADSRHIGRQLREMPFRHTTGINIIKIGRGSRSILIPSGSEYIYPGDLLVAVGTTEQLEAFEKSMAEDIELFEEDRSHEKFVVAQTEVTEDSKLLGVTLRDTDMRSAGCMVVSVVHEGEMITNPKPEYCFSIGDKVWLAGEVDSVNWYKE